MKPDLNQTGYPESPSTAVFLSIFPGNGAVHEHAEPQPRASRRLRAHDQALLRLQGLQQGRQQQQGHQAGCQEEVVLYTSICLKKVKELCHGSKILSVIFPPLGLLYSFLYY